MPRKKAPWDDDPRLGHYIDDNALFVLDSVARGHLSGSLASNYFYIASWHPLEWSVGALVRFLIKTSEEYDIILKNFSTMTYAFEEEYERDLFDPETNEVLPEYESAFEKYFDELDTFEKYKKENGLSNLFRNANPSTKGSPAIKDKVIYPAPKQPKFYFGAYKWALDKIEKDPQSFEGVLFKNIFSNKFDLSDLKEVINISDRIIAVNEPEDSEWFMAKKICDDILNWTSFEIEPSSVGIRNLQIDLEAYLDKFSKDQLTMTSQDRRVGKLHVLQNRNIFTFNRQKEMMIEWFQGMYENHGHTFTFENPYEETPPHDRDTDDELRQRYATRQFLFKHMILALHKLGYIKIISLENNWHWTEQVDHFRDAAKIQLLTPILQELGVKINQGNLYFDTEKSILVLSEKPVVIRKGSKQYEFLRIIFTDPQKEWQFSEVAETMDRYNKGWKKLYNIADAIKKKVLIDTGKKDVFITNTQSIQINQDYLRKS